MSLGCFSAMISRSTIQHLRIPFSFYLMPFFIFACIEAEISDWIPVLLSFLAIHLFLYPASNGYNSFYDRDEESIGGIKNPLPVSKDLLITSLIFDLSAILIGVFFINLEFAFLLLVYGLVSKAYSHPKIRLKKYPVSGLFTVVIFQGFFTYIMVITGIERQGFASFFSGQVLYPAFLCSMLLLGSYPMTQVYQHKEDSRRGDRTISRILGVKGTFFWTAAVFTITTCAFIIYFTEKYSFIAALLFPVFLSPVLMYFLIWFTRIIQDENLADWKSTMQLNRLSAICFLAYFIFLAIYKYSH